MQAGLQRAGLQTGLHEELQAGLQAKLVARAHSLQPILRIGKSGLSDGIISEAKKQLNRKKLIKIKLLRAAIESAEADITGIKANVKGRKKLGMLIEELAERTGSKVIQQTGFTAVLYKR